MKEITGVIDHRILLNYRIDPAVMQRNLPEGFTAVTVKGYAIGGICQVSLSKMRPDCLPACGSSSHNAAHRIAVSTAYGEGVFVPRRDTDSWLNTFSGGRLFPGTYSLAKFAVSVDGDSYTVDIVNAQEETLMAVTADIGQDLPADSVFGSVTEASDFFARGNIGWSPNGRGDGFDAVELTTVNWNMKPLTVRRQYSAYFCDETIFPAGSVTFDCGLIMRGINHSWVSREHLRDVCC
ncbi:MAG: DUF2071 domain-containing protein [Candidatus Omnitrophica bacterium]|nr:DUF2071 domain-containing protein [Candidatus Omnitrophota bacterium]MCB9720892.1 DUF2071 domain-containing protein [Candidatus Omnitrophota bacterium]